MIAFKDGKVVNQFSESQPVAYFQPKLIVHLPCLIVGALPAPHVEKFIDAL